MELVVACANDVGEGPVWDWRNRELVWLDVLAGRVQMYSPVSHAAETVETGTSVGCIGLTTGSSWIAATGRGWASIDRVTGRVVTIGSVPGVGRTHRMNDGAIDPKGRFWAGSMPLDLVAGAGSGVLYTLRQGSWDATPMVSGLTIPNGLAWSPDGLTMYHTDSARMTTIAYDFDIDAGVPSRPRVLLEFGPHEGAPDGMAVDAAGCLWIAMCGGGKVIRVTPTGRRDAEIAFPVSLVTSCAFGDDDLRTLYVTSARRGLGHADLKRQPWAGAVFSVRLNTAGLRTREFSGLAG